jgi:hypothetical protein
MIAVPFRPRADVMRLLAAHGCKLSETLPDGTELWLTKTGHPFTLCPEDPAGDGDWRYDNWQIQQAMQFVWSLMPPDAKPN